mmetsp:Transcript_11076/g.17490  ORF Transcript_11076/g.17490 Transcript_11076/m.17490 type:complete len:81 (-) Transcript_11076:205-447(-)|eukprot:749483-Rhodomonas_salina.3
MLAGSPPISATRSLGACAVGIPVTTRLSRSPPDEAEAHKVMFVAPVNGVSGQAAPLVGEPFARAKLTLTDSSRFATVKDW